MNKQELVAAVAASASLSQVDAARALNVTLDVIQTKLRGGDEVKLVGFGNFAPKNRAAKVGRNPRTGEAVQVPAKTVCKFTPSTTLMG